eukprot:12465055-Ditylum_brightwellii.AAC.1
MNELFADLEVVKAYIDDLLTVTQGSWQNHLDKLEIVLTRLQEAGLKVNMGKSFIGQKKLEYCGYWITREGIMPLSNKVHVQRESRETSSSHCANFKESQVEID